MHELDLKERTTLNWVVAPEELKKRVVLGWMLAPAEQQTEETASQSHETRGIPDPYAFLFENGKIVTLKHRLPIEDFVTRNNPTEEAEFKGLQKIQDWARENEEGMVLWFSPPEPYIDLKIVSTEILHLLGHKVLFNRSVAFEAGSSTALEIANRYPGCKFSDTEELRKTPIVLSHDFAQKWMEPLVDYTDQIAFMETGEDLELKGETLERSVGINNKYEAQRAGLIGSKPDSCARPMFLNGEKSFPCPRCHKAIPSGRGITKCPFCGITKEEVGSTCD